MDQLRKRRGKPREGLGLRDVRDERWLTCLTFEPQINLNLPILIKPFPPELESFDQEGLMNLRVLQSFDSGRI